MHHKQKECSAGRTTLTDEEAVEQLHVELLFYGFAAAKAIARIRGQNSGTMDCPLCQKRLQFSIASCNGHFHARCETPNCINAME